MQKSNIKNKNQNPKIHAQLLIFEFCIVTLIFKI